MARSSIDRWPVAWASALAAAAALLTPVGCGFKIEKITPESETTVEPIGFKSPQAAFAHLRDAAKNNDYAALMQGVTDQTAQVLAGHMLISGAMVQATGKRDRPVNRVLRDHGIDADALDEIQKALATQIRDPGAIYKLADRIENKRRFVADMMKAFMDLGRALPIVGLDADVEHWEIHEDRAIGLIENADGKLEQIAFLRADVGWQVHFAVRRAAPAEKPPAEGAAAPPAEEESNDPPEEAPGEPTDADTR